MDYEDLIDDNDNEKTTPFNSKPSLLAMEQ